MPLQSFSIPDFLQKVLLAAMLFFITASRLAAQSSFKLMRFDEQYFSLKDSTRTLYNRFKYLPLSANGAVYLSFGGEARMEAAFFNNEDWGRVGIGHNNFLLQRYDIHADLHLDARFRVFAQLRSAWENGRKNGPRPIDEDKLNIQNLFADAVLFKKETQSVTVRVGRQELDYGSGRLLSVREGPNLRLNFTGAKIMFNTKRLSVDGFVMAVDTVFTGAFDNKQSHQPNLWGAYGKWIVPHAGNVDLYYLGIRRDLAVFEAGSAKEIRHTVGGRYWKYGGGFIYNIEGAYQFGTFGSGEIRAWTASADLGYMFEQVNGKPTINLRHDYISGDNNKNDNHLGTFNPLYPKGGYFGFDPQIGPVNLIDIHPYSTWSVRRNITVQADVVWNWRYSLQDGIYRPSGGFNLAGAGSSKRYIGTAYLASALWNINKFLTFNTGVQYFHAGSFVRDIIPDPKSGLFINTRIGFKF